MQRTKMIGIAILMLLFTLSACGTNEPSSSTPPQETAPAIESIVEMPEVSTPEPESIVESAIEETSAIEPVADTYIPQYTTTDTSEDALIQLVRDTITINHDRMEADTSPPPSRTPPSLANGCSYTMIRLSPSMNV